MRPRARTYVIVVIALLLWIVLWRSILYAPPCSFRREMGVVWSDNFIGTQKIFNELFVEQYWLDKDNSVSAFILTDSIGFRYGIGSHDTDVMLEYCKYKDHLTIRAFTVIDASDTLWRELYRVDESVPWTKTYKRLEDIIEIDLPSHFKQSSSSDTIKIQIPELSKWE